MTQAIAEKPDTLSQQKLRNFRDHVAKFGISTDWMMEVLSDDAKAVAGGCFGSMVPGKGHLRFGMVENRPTARMQAALDELVAVGAIKSEADRRGAVTYTVQANLNDFFFWMMENMDREDVRFPIAEPIPATA